MTNITRDELAKEYAATYPKVVAQLVDLFVRAEEVDKEVSRVNGSAPAGERRRLAQVELAARNLESFSTADPSIAKAVQLPDWEHSAKMAWPPPRPLVTAWLAPLTADRRYSGDWWQVKEEEARALRERQEREAAEQAAKALENYHGPRWWKRERA